MINTHVFELARKKFLSNDLLLLSEAKEICREKRNYQGIKILHNIPLTVSTIFKIEMLVLGGAEITVTCIKQLMPSKEAIEILNQANIRVQIEHDFDEDYDFHLDCCAQLIDIKPPKIGTIELTQTGSELYKNNRLSYPVISLDDSRLKLIETFYGTGDGYTRALIEKMGYNINNANFVIFGYGKVGQGIAFSLSKHTEHISIVDINDSLLQIACQNGFNVIDGKNKSEVIKTLSNAYCVVTATGVKEAISNYYQLDKNDFGNAILTNMGADDEYGMNFATSDVLFDKKPLNFSISMPTAFKYLDPIFYAHNYGIDLVLSRKMQPGYHPYPQDVVKNILLKWESMYGEKLFNRFGAKTT